MKLIATVIAGALVLSGCAGVATIMGYDTRAANQQAALHYTKAIKSGAEGKVERNTRTARRIHAVFNRMKPYADEANQTGVPFDWELNVVRSDTINAWAMPGGKILFYTGIVEKLNLTDAEIAAIMGHEMVHALKEHSRQKRGAAYLSNLAVQTGKKVLISQGGDAGMVDLGGSLLEAYGLNKPYSRSLEREADTLGMELMARAGYNPEAAPNVWRKMQAYTKSNNGVLARITSTHPVHNDRIDTLTALLPKMMPIYEASNKVGQATRNNRAR